MLDIRSSNVAGFFAMLCVSFMLSALRADLHLTECAINRHDRQAAQEVGTSPVLVPSSAHPSPVLADDAVYPDAKPEEQVDDLWVCDGMDWSEFFVWSYISAVLVLSGLFGISRTPTDSLGQVYSTVQRRQAKAALVGLVLTLSGWLAAIDQLRTSFAEYIPMWMSNL